MQVSTRTRDLSDLWRHRADCAAQLRGSRRYEALPGAPLGPDGSRGLTFEDSHLQKTTPTELVCPQIRVEPRVPREPAIPRSPDPARTLHPPSPACARARVSTCTASCVMRFRTRGGGLRQMIQEMLERMAGVKDYNRAGLLEAEYGARCFAAPSCGSNMPLPWPMRFPHDPPAAPGPSRAAAALLPHCFRTASALHPLCIRSASALLPHCIRSAQGSSTATLIRRGLPPPVLGSACAGQAALRHPAWGWG